MKTNLQPPPSGHKDLDCQGTRTSSVGLADPSPIVEQTAAEPKLLEAHRQVPSFRGECLATNVKTLTLSLELSETTDNGNRGREPPIADTSSLELL